MLILLSPGQDIVRSVAGPMACSLETIERYMEVLPDARPWEVDQHVAPVQWRKELASPGVKRLRIGFVIDDGVVKVQPPIARAMKEAIEALKEAGHDGTHIILQLSTCHFINQHLQCLNGMPLPIAMDTTSGQKLSSLMAVKGPVRRQS
jgi:Asp-tRNA(Asn)/Glu-tRNA(Gln) amidotransferase A subunit family amidase